MEFNREEFLWSQKYRPRKIDDCILPQYLKDTFNKYIAEGQIQNLMLSGSAGVGKTTAAMAMCEEMGCDYIVINASNENGIDVLRTKITAFASSVSLNGGIKVVILDEADALTQQVQKGLRSFMEEYSKNCRFILTVNYANKLIEPLHSRLSPVEFKVPKEDRPQMAAKFMKRIEAVLNNEGVEYDRKVIAAVLTKCFPDFRRTLESLQMYATRGPLDEGVLAHLEGADITELIEALKTKDFKAMRQWVANNVDGDVQIIFTQVFDALIDRVNEVPQMILVVYDYMYKSAFVADNRVNMITCFTELMGTVTFK